MAERGAYARLSRSSQQTMRWAWAHASLRPGRPAVGAFDLLAGLLIAHGDDSEPWQLFRYFGVPVGPVLAADGRSPVRGSQVRAAFDRVGDGSPPLDRDVELVVATGVSELTHFDADGFLTFKALFGALLMSSNRAATTIRTALDEQGAPSGLIAESYHAYLSGPDGYREFLARRFPWPPPLQLPAYATDRPPARKAPPGPADLKPWLEPVRRFWFRAAQPAPATAPAPPAAMSGGARAGP